MLTTREPYLLLPRLTSQSLNASLETGDNPLGFIAKTGWKQLQSLKPALQNQSKVFRVALHIGVPGGDMQKSCVPVNTGTSNLQ